MRGESVRIRHAYGAAWVMAIITASAVIAMAVAWRAPGLDLYARDWLMRARGPLAPPDDIVIIGIDEASMARYGRFPWPRRLMAQALDKIGAAGPKAVALDVLYTEPTTPGDDLALAEAISRSGNVVVAAQLIAGSGDGQAVWLRPLEAVAKAAAGVGHVDVATGFDGVARVLPLRQADDSGSALWAMAVEATRVGDRLSPAEVREIPEAVRIGRRELPVDNDPGTLVVGARAEGARVETLRADRLWLDYIGPTGSFSAQTYGIGELLDGRVAPEQLRGKYVLIGATAASLGERVASPFVRGEGRDGEPRGELMPGVEVLANEVNTILRGRFYQEAPDWVAALCAALAAAAVVGALAFAQGRHELVKQLASLGGVIALVLGVCYFAFAFWQIVPPVVPALVSAAVAAPLALLRRSLAMSSDLDARIAELARAGASLSTTAGDQVLASALRPNPAALIARLIEADAVAIFARRGTKSEDYRLLARHGAPPAPSLSGGQARAPLTRLVPRRSVAEATMEAESAAGYFAFGPDRQSERGEGRRALTIHLGEAHEPAGALVLAHPADREPTSEELILCRELATGYLALAARHELDREGEPARGRWLPRGGEWKARALGVLNRSLVARTRFVNLALRSVEDGLILAAVDGRIAFANPRAAAILGVPERLLPGSDLFDRIHEAGEAGRQAQGSLERATRETLLRLVVERSPIEREITVGDAPARHYTLRLAPVSDREDGAGAVLGVVASLSDITKQRELQQTKNDVMALVTHELRTPLTSIQAMSEVLAQYEVDPERRREMHQSINDEAKRLARMIEEYLDITRLESGARPLRPAPVRAAALLERALLILDPVAAQRGIRITRRFTPNLPALLADADLISRAVTNLVGNAIKYSPARTEVVVTAEAEGEALRVDIADQGHGIPEEARGRIFEKFYRVPRVEDADVPGTGLGLAFVREIAEMHGGRVTVQSEAGVGSTFSLRLPLAPPEK